MDRFTETYIEMVSKAKEIQKLCKYNKGDWFIGTFAFYHSEKPKPKVFCKSGLGSFDPREHSWLPTLEDLFVMVDIKNGKDFDKLSNVMWDENAFGEIVINPKYGNCNDLHSMILILVMEMNYNKSWNTNKKEWEERNGS